MGLPMLRAMDDSAGSPGQSSQRDKIKIVVYGEELIEKTVTVSGACGRVYLPREWLGKAVKIVRME